MKRGVTLILLGLTNNSGQTGQIDHSCSFQVYTTLFRFNFIGKCKINMFQGLKTRSWAMTSEIPGASICAPYMNDSGDAKQKTQCYLQ